MKIKCLICNDIIESKHRHDLANVLNPKNCTFNNNVIELYKNRNNNTI